MITVDTREIDKMIFKLRRRFPQLVPKVISGYVNSLGFHTKKNSEAVMNQKFKFANNSTKRFTERGVHFRTTGKNTPNVQTEVGATGELHGTTLKSRKASYLARQELGGTVTQVKRTGGTRGNLIAPNPKNTNKRKLLKNIVAKASKPRRGTKDKKHALWSALVNARRKKKPYAMTPFGIYRVLKRSAKLTYIYKRKDSIRTPKRPWLQPSVDLTIKRKDTIFRNQVIRKVKDELKR